MAFVPVFISLLLVGAVAGNTWTVSDSDPTGANGIATIAAAVSVGDIIEFDDSVATISGKLTFLIPVTIDGKGAVEVEDGVEFIGDGFVVTGLKFKQGSTLVADGNSLNISYNEFDTPVMIAFNGDNLDDPNAVMHQRTDLNFVDNVFNGDVCESDDFDDEKCNVTMMFISSTKNVNFFGNVMSQTSLVFANCVDITIGGGDDSALSNYIRSIQIFAIDNSAGNVVITGNSIGGSVYPWSPISTFGIAETFTVYYNDIYAEDSVAVDLYSSVKGYGYYNITTNDIQSEETTVISLVNIVGTINENEIIAAGGNIAAITSSSSKIDITRNDFIETSKPLLSFDRSQQLPEIGIYSTLDVALAIKVSNPRNETTRYDFYCASSEEHWNRRWWFSQEVASAVDGKNGKSVFKLDLSKARAGCEHFSWTVTFDNSTHMRFYEYQGSQMQTATFDLVEYQPKHGSFSGFKTKKVGTITTDIFGKFTVDFPQAANIEEVYFHFADKLSKIPRVGGKLVPERFKWNTSSLPNGSFNDFFGLEGSIGAIYLEVFEQIGDDYATRKIWAKGASASLALTGAPVVNDNGGFYVQTNFIF